MSTLDVQPEDLAEGPAVLVVGGLVEDAAGLAAATSRFKLRLVRVANLEQALEGTANTGFDAVLLHSEALRGLPVEKVRHFRDGIGDAVVVVAGPDRDLVEHAGFTVEDWLDPSHPPGTVHECLRAAVERHRLRNLLHRNEQELAELKHRFAAIVDHTSDGILIVGDDRRIRFVNAAAEAILGRPSRELVGEELDLVMGTGESTEMDIMAPTQGGMRVAELRASETTWKGERARVVSLRDVTDRKRGEERARRLAREQDLREHAERESGRLRFLAEAAASLDSSLDPEATLHGLARLSVPRFADWCVIDVVEGTEVRRVAGLHRDAGKQGWLDRLRSEYAPRAHTPQPVNRVLRTGEPQLLRGVDPNRVRPLATGEEHARILLELGVRSSITVPIRTRDRILGAITLVRTDRDYDENDLALAREIGGRAGQAIENATLYDAALAASRAKSDFLAVVSHELRTPLNAILGYTDLLLSHIGQFQDKQDLYLERVRSGALQLLEIIEQILSYSQSDSGRAHPDVAIRTIDLVREIEAVAEPLAQQKGLTFHVEVAHPDTVLETDTAKVRQIALYFLSNAVKFTDAGTVSLHVDTGADDILIAVRDTGSGIPLEKQGEIFEPFQQVEHGRTRSVGGMGLGLTLARKLAHVLGGEVRVESQPGAGSTFTLRVPRRLHTRRR